MKKELSYTQVNILAQGLLFILLSQTCIIRIVLNA